MLYLSHHHSSGYHKTEHISCNDATSRQVRSAVDEYSVRASQIEAEYLDQLHYLAPIGCFCLHNPQGGKGGQPSPKHGSGEGTGRTESQDALHQVLLWMIHPDSLHP